MKRLVAVVATAAALSAGAVEAHGVGSERGGTAEAVRFFYIGGEPMAYASIKVFSPVDDRAEYQSGFADGQGYFAFVPNAAGTWRIVGNDGMGHSGEIAVSHRDAATLSPENVAAAGSTAATMPWKAALGLSLILNLTLLAQWAVRRAMQRRSLHGTEATKHAHQ